MAHYFACRVCGAINDYEKRCPDPECGGSCTYCKQSGHTKDGCPKLFCRHCDKQEHKPLQCPKQSSRPMRRNPTHTKATRLDPYKSSKMKTSPKTPAFDLEELQSQVDHYQSLGDTSHIFPDLRCILSHLLSHFGPDRATEPGQIIYRDWIAKLGGQKKAEDLLFDLINEDIKGLQGQLITA